MVSELVLQSNIVEELYSCSCSSNKSWAFTTGIVPETTKCIALLLENITLENQKEQKKIEMILIIIYFPVAFLIRHFII